MAAGVLGLHECDNPVCVKIAAETDVQQHVVSGSQGDNMERMARMRRGGGRHVVRRFDSRGVLRERSVALRDAVRHGPGERPRERLAALQEHCVARWAHRCGVELHGQRADAGCARPTDAVLANRFAVAVTVGVDAQRSVPAP